MGSLLAGGTRRRRAPAERRGGGHDACTFPPPLPEEVRAWTTSLDSFGMDMESTVRVYGERRLTARDTDSSRKRNGWSRQGPSTTL